MQMKITHRILTLLILAMAVQTVLAKKERVSTASVYMFGVAVSYNDSTVYITDMQQVDGVTIENKHKFLMDRQAYSIQLQSDLQNRYGKGPFVSALFFGQKSKKVERQYLKVRKRYADDTQFRLVPVDQNQFRFKPEEYIEQLIIQDADDSDKEKKKDKKKEKKSK